MCPARFHATGTKASDAMLCGSAARQRHGEVRALFDTYIGTTGGAFRLRDGALEPLGLEAERVSAIHAWHDGEAATVLAGTYGNGLFRSADGGRTWSRAQDGLTASAFRFLMPDPGHPGALLAGTEPARVFRSEDGGE